MHAVQQLRGAPEAARDPFLRALEHEACTSADVCELRRVCVEAYRDEQGAMAGIHALEHAVDSDAAAPPAGSAAALLSESQRRLERAHAGTRRCTDLESALVRADKL